MSDQPGDWNDVAENFTQLGRMLQERFSTEQQEEDEASGRVGSEASDPLRSLGDAMTRLGERISATAADPDVRTQARKAADAFTSALGSTFGSAADEISGMMRGRRAARADEEPWMQASDSADWPTGTSTSKEASQPPEQLERPGREDGPPNGSGPAPSSP